MIQESSDPTFEEAIGRLEEIVRQLEGEAISLEESLKLFEEGMKLTGLCRKRLQEAEAKIKTLTRNRSGELKAEENNDG